MVSQRYDNQTGDIAGWLNEGIAAAKSGDRERARMLLTQVVTQDERNIHAWLWLSGVVDSLEDREICLENVLSLDPQNPVAQKGLVRTREDYAQSLIQKGTMAAKNGKNAEAREHFRQAAERLPHNIEPWQWLSNLAETPWEREGYLNKILEIDPYNEMAHRTLAQLESEKQRQAPPFSTSNFEPEPELDPSPFFQSDPEPPTLSRHADGADAFAPVPQGSEQWQALDDEMLCPYCAKVKTKPDDKTCPVCRQPLWTEIRTNDNRGKAYWFITVCHGLEALIYFICLIVAVAAKNTFLQIFNQILHAYPSYQSLLQRSNLTPQLIYLGITFIFLIYTLISTLLTIGWLARWKGVFYLAIVGLVFSAIQSLANLGNYSDNTSALVGALIGTVISLGINAWILFSASSAFDKEKVRILLEMDRDAKPANTALDRGKMYGEMGMWALSALHYRHAAGMLTNAIGPQLALGRAYLKLNRPELAAIALQQAEQIDPNHKMVQDFRKLLQSSK